MNQLNKLKSSKLVLAALCVAGLGLVNSLTGSSVATAAYRLIQNSGSAVASGNTILNCTGVLTCADAGSGVTSLAVNSNSSILDTGIVSVSSAEMLNLIAAPKQIVAAPGAGKVITVINYLVKYNFVANDYVNPSGVLSLRIGTTTTAFGTNFVTCCTILLATTVFGPLGPIINSAARATESDIVNAPLQLAKTISDLTTGDGTLQIRVRYLIADYP